MATLVLSAAGRALGGPALALAESVIGSYADAQIFGTNAQREGPRLSDLAVQSSAYGAPIPLVYGTMRVAGNVIWSTGLIETRHESSAGGGKRGGSVTNVTYSYAVSCAVAVAGRPIQGIGRIWADGKLLRDAAGAMAAGGSLRIHRGDETQNPDPLIQAHQGAGATPAFRGLAYAVFEDLQLAEFANRIPNLTFEVIADPAAALGGIAADLAARAGVTAVDAAALDQPVAGFAVARTMTARKALEGLQAVYAFDASDADGRLTFGKLPRAAAAVLDESDLSAHSPGQDRPAPLARRRTQECELPREIAVEYLDAARDYQAGVQRARRMTTASRQVEIVAAALVMTPDAAKQAAEIQLGRRWMGRDALSFQLGPRHAALSPGDTVRVAAGGASQDAVIRTIEMDGGLLKCEAAAEDAAIYQSAAAGSAGMFPGQTVIDPGMTTAHLMDIPPLTDAQAARHGFYALGAGASIGWRGGRLFLSRDDGDTYADAGALADGGVMGMALSALPAGPAAFWDEAANVTVHLLNANMALQSRGELAVLNGGNAALIGNEIVQFRNAVLQPDGNYALSGLLRGRIGTEWAMAGHAAGERFVLLDGGALAVVDVGSDAIGKTYLAKAATLGQALDAATAAGFAYTGENLRPLSPVHARASRNAAGDIALSWIRRARSGAEWRDLVDAPLDEAQESYEIDIMNGAMAARTLASSSPAILYTAAQQTADFGGVQASVHLRIHQMGAQTGRGRPLDIIL